MSDPKSGGNTRKTLVDEGTQFKGSLSSDCPIEVKGRIEGEVTAPSLLVSATGAMKGKVKVGELRSDGELAGDFDADTVRLSGTVKDNTVIRAKSLEVKLSSADGKMQVVFGDCELQVGDEQPAKETAPARPSDRPKRGKGTSVPPEAEANGAS
jgi:cytoskeletal protein CcmA (bactofilin family)